MEYIYVIALIMSLWNAYGEYKKHGLSAGMGWVCSAIWILIALKSIL